MDEKELLDWAQKMLENVAGAVHIAYVREVPFSNKVRYQVYNEFV